MLRNGTHVPKVLSQPRNPLRNRTFVPKSAFFTSQCVSQLPNDGSCAAKWHSCAKSAFAAAKSSAEWGFGCQKKKMNFFFFRSHSCAKIGFAAAKHPSKWSFPCEMEDFQMGTPVLRSGTRVPKVVSQLRKFSQRVALGCEMISQQSGDFATKA